MKLRSRDWSHSLPDNWWRNGSQLLCGRNKTRHSYNDRARAKLGFSKSDFPVAGDRLVCLRNNHMEGLLNGSLWTVQEATYGEGALYFSLKIVSDDDEKRVVECLAHKRIFIEADPYKA